MEGGEGGRSLCMYDESTDVQTALGGGRGREARKESASIYVVSRAVTALKGARGKRGG